MQKLLDLPKELILLIASFLDEDSLLHLRLVSKLLERITQPLFFNIANDKLESDTFACGEASVILVCPSGQVWGWGSNWSNQLALDDYSYPDNCGPYFTPRESSLKNVIKVAMGYGFSLAIMKDGTVVSSGTGTEGPELNLLQILPQYLVPKEIPVLKDATQIAAGHGFALAVKKDGTLFSWGRNNWGQLGHGDQEDCFTPKVVSSIKNVDKIAVGHDFSVALTKNGALYIWGCLGLGPEANRPLTPQEVITLEDVVSISAGKNFILALKNDGTVITWGFNQGLLGVGIEVPNLKNIVKISVNNSPDSECCLALSKEGNVYSWEHSKVWFQTDVPEKVIGLEKIVAIGQGVNFSVALNKDGVLYSLGINNSGQLGINKEYSKCNVSKKVGAFEKPAKTKTKFFNTVTKRLVNERLTKTALMPAQKASVRQELTSFSLSNETQLEKEIGELRGIINDEKSSAAQIEDKIDNYLKIYSSSEDFPKISFCSSLNAMKQKLSAEKAKIVEVTKAEVFSHIMKRS